jgi:hypothetical protein
MFHTYVILLILQSILKGSLYNFRIMIRDMFLMYSRCMITYSTPTSPWHSDALSITIVSLKVYNTRYNRNALPCHNLMHY